MKAKEVIQLYEDEEKLSSDEAVTLINSYFIKKCKSIGMKINYLNSPFPSSASLTLTSRVSFNVSQGQKYFKQYLKKVSDTLKKNNIKVIKYSSTLEIYLPRAVSSVWINNGVYYITVDTFGFDVAVRIYKSRYLDVLADYEEFSSELNLSEVYKLIDIMVKAIRLTPLELR